MALVARENTRRCRLHDDTGRITQGAQTNIPVLLLRAARWFEDGLVQPMPDAAGTALRRRHVLVFAHLPPDGIRPTELARRIGISRQAIHETVAQLEELDLVERVADPVHRRARIVRLTELGEARVAEVQRAFATLERRLARRIGAARVVALRDVLEADWSAAAERHEPAADG